MAKVAGHTASRRRVLFVDDSRLMRYAGSRFLAGHCRIIVARDGREAWALLNGDERVDLVFTDLMMPVMDGHELIRRIRSCRDARIRTLPILVVTSHEEAAARELAISEGANDFIPKPFSPEDLRQALESDFPRRADSEPRIAGLPAPEDPPDADADSGTIQEPARYLKRLHQALSFHQRQQLELALLHIQFQGYWHVSNRYGQAWADAVMRNLHRILDFELRDEDSIHRTAPDLFSIILMGTGRNGARVLNQRVRNRLTGKRMRFASMEIPIDLRFAAQFPDLNGNDEARELLDSALRLIHWRTSDAPDHRPAAANVTRIDRARHPSPG